MVSIHGWSMDGHSYCDIHGHCGRRGRDSGVHPQMTIDDPRYPCSYTSFLYTRCGEVLGHSCGVSEEHHAPVGGGDQPGGGARGATSKSVPWFPQDKACIRVSTIDRPFKRQQKQIMLQS